MSSKTIGRAVGALFLLAFLVYIAGGALVDSGYPRQIPPGALLMLLNSIAVAGIGILAFPVLKPNHQISAYGYLITRAIEAVLLAVGIVFLLLLIPIAQDAALRHVAKEGNFYAYQLAMISVGIGGMLLCRVLWRVRLAPRFIAAWGFAGYAIFLAGAVLEVLGYHYGVALSIPGGLFEIALGILLLAKGFPQRANVTA